MRAGQIFVKGLVVALALISSAHAGDWSKVRVGTEGAYPPFNFVDTDGQLKGFDVDIARALCEKIKAECTFVAQDWDGIIPALLAKKYDAIIASMSITEERKKKVDFTDKYYNTPAKFVVKKGSGFGGSNPADMAGKTIGAQSSTTHASYLEDNYPDSKIRLYPTQDEANADLAAGRLDAILADSVALLEWMEKTEEGKCCEYASGDHNDPKWFGSGAGIAVRQGDADLRDMLNKALAEILADGTYKRINDQYFPFSVY